MDALLQDVRHGVRALASSRAFLSLSVLCLGLGIGLNTMVFTVVNGVLLLPLPLADPDRLVLIHEVRQTDPQNHQPVSYQNFRDVREYTHDVAQIAAMRPVRVTVVDREAPERVSAAVVTSNLLPTLGIEPVLGRGFREDEDAPAGAPVVLLSEALWERRYARDPRVLGRSVALDGRAHTVVGVMPRLAHPAVAGALRAAQLWLPLAPAEHGSARDDRALTVYARLVGQPAEVSVRVAAIAGKLEEEHPENRGWRVVLRPMARSVSTSTRALLLAIMGAVACVLLVACANVANLSLARARRRRREIAVRVALGASRGRLLRQLLTESVLVGLLSAPVGLLLASWGVSLLFGVGQTTNIELPLDGRVYTFTIVAALLTSILFGLAPALHALDGTTGAALGDSGRDVTTGRRQVRLRNTLVVFEVAVSLVLLVGAALFVRSFLSLLQKDTGFDTRPLLTFRVELADDPDASRETIVGRLGEILARLQAVPGVRAAAASSLVPLRGGGGRTRAFAEGRPDPAGTGVVCAGVTRGFLASLGLPLIRGRDFTEQEFRADAAVAIVSRRMAERVWPGVDALGRRFRFAADPRAAWYTVVGISPDLPNWDLSDRPLPTAYVPYGRMPDRDPLLLIHAGSDPLSVAGSVRAAIQDVDPALPISDLRTMSDVHRLAFWRQALFGRVLAVFGGIALVLAVVGLYGVLTYLVSERVREIGIRVAIGASRADIVRMIVRQGITLLAAGLVVGLSGAWAATRVVRRLLHDVSATDPISLAGAALLLAGVGFLASYLPARRAAAMDPVAAMRD